LIALVLLALFPLTGSTFYIQLGAKILIMAIFALSLDLLVGHTGLVSFGHAAYFGLAAYALALISPKYEPANVWMTLPLSMAIAAFAALVIGFFVLRTTGVYFIMVTLAFAQMLYSVFHDTQLGGGSDGIYIYVRPELTIAGFKPLDLESPLQFYYFVLILLILVYGFLKRILQAPFGRALAGIRLNEQRMRSIGFPIFGYKLGAFVIAWSARGAGGLSRACQFGFVNPDILAWQQSGTVLMMVILGRHGSAARRCARRVGVRAAARNSFRPGYRRRVRQALAVAHGLFDRGYRARVSPWHWRHLRRRATPLSYRRPNADSVNRK
jgi:branched-chain amino acid transport system permease protein